MWYYLFFKVFFKKIIFLFFNIIILKQFKNTKKII
jgi:hypothetical protein